MGRPSGRRQELALIMFFFLLLVLLPFFIWNIRLLWQWTPDTLTKAQILAEKARRSPPAQVDLDLALIQGHRRFIRAQEAARR